MYLINGDSIGYPSARSLWKASVNSCEFLAVIVSGRQRCERHKSDCLQRCLSGMRYTVETTLLIS